MFASLAEGGDLGTCTTVSAVVPTWRVRWPSANAPVRTLRFPVLASAGTQLLKTGSWLLRSYYRHH